MHMHKPYYPKRSSGRLIVDEYEQIKRGREEESTCPHCSHQIPLRLMNSHLNVCAFGSSQESIQNQSGCEGRQTSNQMAASTLSHPNKKIDERNGSQKPNSKVGNNSKLAHERKLTKPDNEQLRNFSTKKESKMSCDRRLGAANSKAPMRTSFSNKRIDTKKEMKIGSINKSLVSDEYGEYFGDRKKKQGISKVQKDVKKMWLDSANKKKRESDMKRESEFRKREERLRMMETKAEKLKSKQEKLMKEIEKQRKNKFNIQRNNSRIKTKRQESRRKQQKPPQRASSKSRNRNQRTEQRQNRNRGEQSYYEEIPIHHPHRTMNFISQTINEQFEMMKEQFDQMNEFFSNFVPFSNNGFVYFERNEDSDYSQYGASFGMDDLEEGRGLFDEQIQLLPRYSYIKKLGGDDQCAVCISSIKHSQMVRRLPCQHFFHCECIDEWLRRRAACPVCRDQIDE